MGSLLLLVTKGNSVGNIRNPISIVTLQHSLLVTLLAKNRCIIKDQFEDEDRQHCRHI